VDIKRRFAITVILGAGIPGTVVGLTGCQGGGLGKLALWNRGDSTASSAAPDVGRQKYSGLAQEFPGSMPMGQARTGTAPLGGQKPVSDDGFMMASWKKTTAAVTGAFASTTKPANAVPEDDPLRLDRNPKKIGPEVYVSAARLLENQGKFAEAEVKYQDALKTSPTDEHALVGLARLHDRQGQGLKATDLYLKALKAHPNSGLVCNDLGLCYRRQRQLDKSVQMFSRAVELQPDNNKYRNNLAAALVDAGRADDAVRHLSTSGSPAVAHYNVGFMLHKRGQQGEAVQHLQHAISLDPSLTPAREMLAQLGGESPAQPHGPAASLAAAAFAGRAADGSSRAMPRKRLRPPAHGSRCPVRAADVPHRRRRRCGRDGPAASLERRCLVVACRG
jgi:Tfp pilus assembly protein PilF